MSIQTAAISLTIGLAASAATMIVWWLIERMGSKRRLALVAECISDAQLLFPLSDTDIDDLSRLGARQAWAGTKDLFKALSKSAAGNLSLAVRRKVGAGPREETPEELANTCQIEPGTRATLEVVVDEVNTWRTVMMSGWITGTKETVIFFEPDKMSEQFPAEAPVKLRFRRPDDAAYEFKSHLASDSRGSLLKIYHPQMFSRVQERAHTRTRIGRLTNFYFMSEGELTANVTHPAGDKINPHPARGILVDLSGGGAAVRSRRELHTNDFIAFDFSALSDRGSEGLPGRKVWGRVIECTMQTSPGQDDEKPWWRSRIRFVNIDDEERRCIVRYVDHRHLRERRLSA